MPANPALPALASAAEGSRELDAAKWFVTSPNPITAARSRTENAGQRGWRTHYVAAGSAEKTFHDIRSERAACGLRAHYGWTIDLFIERPCRRCLAALRAREAAP